MKSIKIHGNDYVMVKDRIIYFNENYPNGSIISDSKLEGTSYICKTTVIPDVENEKRKFTGHAEEIIGSSQINKTSALENCETSAIGRALGCMGIGVEESFSSANEVQNAKHQQNYKYIKTDNELEKFVKYKNDDYFKTHMEDIKMSVGELNDNWDMCNSKTKTHEFIKQMETRIKERKKGELEHENS